MINNYHTHTNLCDGKNSIEDMVKSAIKLGLTEIGFSGHSYAPWDSSCLGMDKNTLQTYFEQIDFCRKKYDRIKIYCGIELDYYSEVDTNKFDYVIGAVHYVKKGGEYIPIDYKKDILIDSVNRLYGGDFNEFLADYYNLIGQLYDKTKCNVVAHIDLVTKLNKNQQIFSQSGAIYRKLAISSVQKLIKQPCFFEVNTGGIARGYMDNPYPQNFILEEIASSGKPFLLSSDAHSAEGLIFGLQDAKEQLEKKGYKYIKTLKEIL